VTEMAALAFGLLRAFQDQAEKNDLPVSLSTIIFKRFTGKSKSTYSKS